MTFLRAVSDEKGTTDAKAMINPTNTTATASAAVRHGCFRGLANLDGISIIGHFQVSREPDPSGRSFQRLRAEALGAKRLLAKRTVEAGRAVPLSLQHFAYHASRRELAPVLTANLWRTNGL